MIRRLAVLALLGALPATRSEAVSRFATPSPGVLESLNRQLHRNDWLVITSDSVQYEARFRELGASGLGGLSPFRSSSVGPETIPWSEVSGLDLRRSSLRKYQILGFAAGFALGLEELHFTGSAFGGARALGAMTLGAAAGTLVGNWLGAHRYYERRIFDGVPAGEGLALADSSTAAQPDSSRESISANEPVSSVGVTSVDSTRIAHVLWRLHPRQRVRLHGDFGSFEGYVTYAGQQKLEGLVPGWASDRSRSPHELEWGRVAKVETLGNQSLHHALVIGAALGGLGLLVGMPAGAVADPSSNYSFAVGGLIGFGIMGSVGATIGGLAGSGVQAWHVVYRRK